MRPALLASLLVLAADSARAAPVEFNRDVRPILAENCFACHGPDTAKRKAGLRLDTPQGASAAVVPGKPEESELYRRVVGLGDGKRMPPPKSNKVVTAAQAEVLRRWIAGGAKFEAHWSFLPPRRAELPAVRDSRWGRNAVDRFVLARLEREGLRPSAEADRRTLIRRLSFDLTGLPPTPEDVDAFVADRSERAYEKLAERLLASRHHGERMALFWLDLVRFADTAGYHSDNHRDISLYRDWVIDSFAANKRFDAFTIEQLAGDLLPNPTREQRIASGYNRLLQTTEEGGAQAKEYTAKYAADRVRNAGSVWLGLTVGCAECHSHKYDPITTKEFYSFAAFWADVQEVAVGRQPQTKLPTPEQEAEKVRLTAELAEARKALATPTPALRAAQALWEKTARDELPRQRLAWKAVKPVAVSSSSGATLATLPDATVLASGKNPAHDTYTLTLPIGDGEVTALRLAALRHPTLAGGGFSRANGNFVLTAVKVEVVGKDGKAAPVALARAEADFSQAGFPASSLVAGKGPGWAVEGHFRRDADRHALLVFSRPVAAGPGTTLRVRLEHNSAFAQHNIGRFRIDRTAAPSPGLADKAGLPAPVAQALAVDPARRSEAQKNALTAYYLGIAPAVAPVRAKVAGLEARLKALDAAAPQSLVTTAGPPRVVRVLPRGNWLDDSGEIVAPGVPASLPKLRQAGKRATRLDLARWLVSEEHPLVARVFVNRLWKLFYGAGLVTSMEDFGSQGTHPSHPELLDWLAVEFRQSGWDVRHLIRLMVTSSAYRQTSSESPTLRQRDPYNHLLARQGRFRLDAEFVRDNALAVSGLLSRKLGGPSVKPYQPAGYWAYLNFPTRDWVEDRGPDQYRRGLYTYWQRSFPHPSLLAFDAPSREECTADRPRSNTPQQALVLLNDPSYVEAARVLAEKTVRAGPGDGERLAFACRRVLGRRPEADEARLLLALLEKHRGEYRADPAAAEALMKIGQAPAAKGADRAELAAWASVARVLLNLHETITRE